MFDHFIDMYSKLLIGITSFGAPITTYLLTNYIDRKRRNKILNKLDQQRDTINEFLNKEMRTASEKGTAAIDFIKQSNEKLKASEKGIDYKIELLQFLQPNKKRIIWVFFPFFAAIIFLFFDILVRDNAFNWYNHKLSIVLLTLSCLLFIIGMSILWYLVWRLIDAKEVFTDEEAELTLEEASPLIPAKE